MNGMTEQSGSGPQSVIRLSEWYRSQCDGYWEHKYGVSIGTLDNPGWCVCIDLTGTDYQIDLFKPYEKESPVPENEWEPVQEDWVICSLSEDRTQFIAHGDERKLEFILQYFLNYV